MVQKIQLDLDLKVINELNDESIIQDASAHEAVMCNTAQSGQYTVTFKQ